MTKREALEKTIEMWSWIRDKTLSEERIVSKEEYFEFIDKKDSMYFDCYLCEYTFYLNSSTPIMDCENCPIKWTNKVSNIREDSECAKKPDSPYYQWVDCIYKNFDYTIAAECANKVVELAKKTLEESKEV